MTLFLSKKSACHFSYYSVEHKTLDKEARMPLFPRLKEWQIKSNALHRPKIEEKGQVVGEFQFGGHESNTRRKTLLKMWNERQKLIRIRQENIKT